MADAPGRIWLLPFDGEQRTWCDDADPAGSGDTSGTDEYTRTDLIAAMLTKAIQAEREACAQIADQNREYHDKRRHDPENLAARVDERMAATAECIAKAIRARGAVE